MTDSSDSAVERRGDPSRRWLQRARTSDPTDGIEPPESAASATSSQPAASRQSAARSNTRLIAVASAAHGRIRL